MKLTFDKVDLSITKEDKKYLIIHGFIIIFSLFVSGYLVSEFWQSYDFILVGELIFIAIVIVSLLDCLNVIELRKSVKRHTKCVVCGITNEPSHEIDTDDNDLGGMIVSATEIKINPKTDSKTITEHVRVPAKPLTGLVVNNKVVCLDCVKAIRELKP